MRSLLALSALLVTVAGAAGCMGDTSDGGFSGDVTFESGFDESDDWPTGLEETYDYGIFLGPDAGAYSMAFGAIGFEQLRQVAVGPDELSQTTIADSVQSVEVRSGTPESPYVGLLCRWNKETGSSLTGYDFAVNTRPGEQSVWVVNRTVDGDTERLAGGNLDLDLSEAAASLEASCVGETLAFTIDGDEVASVTDTTIANGNNGLVGVVNPGREESYEAKFDNYVLEYDEA